MIYAHLTSDRTPDPKNPEKSVYMYNVSWFGSKKDSEKWQKKIEKFSKDGFDKNLTSVQNILMFFARNNFIPAGIGKSERVFYLPKNK